MTYPSDELACEDINKIIVIINEHINKDNSHLNDNISNDIYIDNPHINNNLSNDINNYNKCNELIKSAYYALGGDYPDEESVEHASNFGYSQLNKVTNLVSHLSYSKLKLLKKDLLKISKKMEKHVYPWDD
jgi:hypothetical protein